MQKTNITCISYETERKFLAISIPSTYTIRFSFECNSSTLCICLHCLAITNELLLLLSHPPSVSPHLKTNSLQPPQPPSIPFSRSQSSTKFPYRLSHLIRRYQKFQLPYLPCHIHFGVILANFWTNIHTNTLHLNSSCFTDCYFLGVFFSLFPSLSPSSFCCYFVLFYGFGCCSGCFVFECVYVHS